jgi:crotonobetainyl-CoA:carnitine CoA-transferase CaiB-like acyl-CoA transferase
MAIGRADLVDQQFPGLPGSEEVAHIKNEVQAVLSKRTNEEWREVFREKDCCVEIGKD